MARNAIAFMLLVSFATLHAQDERLVPSSLTKDQRDNLLQFLKSHEKPTSYFPKGAKVGDVAPPAAEAEIVATKEKPIKQYTVQVTPHRPVPGQEKVTKADVYYYRPNPEKGKQGLTVKYTLDLTTGKQVGEAEVMTKAHTAISNEERDEAVAKLKEKSEAVKALYQGREEGAVRYEYLQMKVNRKSADFEPGDRVLRFVFTAVPAEGEKAPSPVVVRVNLTRDQIVPEGR